MRKLGKAGKSKMSGGMTALVLFLVIAVLIIGYFTIGQSVVGNQDDGKTITNCDSQTTPNLTINAYDLENPGTALTEATNLYRIKGQTTWKTFTAGTGFSVGVGETLEIVMGISTSDFTDNAYGDYFEYTVPCEETPTIEKGMYNDEVETSLTSTFYNADGDASAETFSAGESQVVSIKMKAGTDEVFGNPLISGNPNVIVLGLNSTEWDQPNQVYLEGGQELSSVEVPGRLSSVAGIKFYAYEIPVITDKEVRVYLDLNADDSTAPATDMTGYIYAGNWFINGDTANVDSGVETDEDAAVGTDAADSVTLDFTA